MIRIQDSKWLIWDVLVILGYTPYEVYFDYSYRFESKATISCHSEKNIDHVLTLSQYQISDDPSLCMRVCALITISGQFIHLFPT